MPLFLAQRERDREREQKDMKNEQFSSDRINSKPKV